MHDVTASYMSHSGQYGWSEYMGRLRVRASAMAFCT